MKRPLAPDYSHDRARWAGLIRDAHEAAADPTATRLRDLAEASAAARDTWMTAAPYPAGLIFPLFAAAALAWARHGLSYRPDERGSRLLGVVLETASLADEALAAAMKPTVRAPTMAELDAAPRARLPYRDDA